jgi:hypothetical protein
VSSSVGYEQPRCTAAAHLGEELNKAASKSLTPKLFNLYPLIPWFLPCINFGSLLIDLPVLHVMDPFSAARSAIAIVQIADRIIALCKAYITGAYDAPADLRAILIEVGSLKCVLEVIELLAPSHGGDDGVDILERLAGPLEGCKEALGSLESLFPPQSQSQNKGNRKRLALSIVSLAWPFKKEKALKLLEELGRHKSTIALGLTTEAALVHRRKDALANFYANYRSDKI